MLLGLEWLIYLVLGLSGCALSYQLGRFKAFGKWGIEDNAEW